MNLEMLDWPIITMDMHTARINLPNNNKDSRIKPNKDSSRANLPRLARVSRINNRGNLDNNNNKVKVNKDRASREDWEAWMSRTTHC